MNTNLKAGICMDHSSANIIEFSTEPQLKTTIDSKFTHDQQYAFVCDYFSKPHEVQVEV